MFDEKIMELNLPTGKPLVFEITEELKITAAPKFFEE